MLEIHNGGLKVNEILAKWYEEYKFKNYGAFVPFVGIVRDENGISGLSFDVYEPILNKWFKAHQENASKLNAVILMAHSKGDVLNHETSFMACVVSPQRKVALKLINDFVEDFKASAPIWKYDLIGGERIYAKDRSRKLAGAGILG